MVQNIYYIIASLGILFTGIMTFLTYKLNKKTEESEERTKQVADEIKNIYETNNEKRMLSEAIVKLLELFLSLDEHLNELNKTDEVIKISGITIENTVNRIESIVSTISEYSYVFTENNKNFDTGVYASIESLLREHDYSHRKNTVRNISRTNTEYKGFLRAIQKGI